MPNWNDSDIVQWKESAKSNQQYYCDRLDDRHYDSHSAEDYKYLKLKIAFSLFGSPSDIDENDEVDILAYNTEQQKCTKLMFDQLVANSKSDIQVSFIFLMIKQYDQQYQLPVIRFVSSNNSERFLDHYSRIYDSWDAFTKWNELPECLYCYPVNGWYRVDDDDDVKVTFSVSPRCNVGEKAVKYADYASIGANLGSLGLVAVGLLFPPAAPVCLPAATYIGATSGVYSVGRNATKLVDRGYHGQSVNPFSDSQARSCWLGTVGGALGIGTLGAARYITYLAQEGDVASKIMRVTFNTVSISSLTVNGIGIVTNIYDLSQKDKVTAQDVANLTLNILFFAHTAVNLQTARGLIKNTQRNVIDTKKMKMDDQAQAGFKAFAKQNRRELRSTMYGNAKTIKGLKRIDNPNAFFADLQQVRIDANVNAAGVAKNIRVRVNNDLLVSLNGELKVHPSKWASANIENRTELLECAKQINQNPDSAFDYIEKVKKICSAERITFERTRQNTMKVLAEKLGVPDAANFEIDGKKVFENLRPYEIDRIGNVIESKGRNATDDFIKCVTLVAKELGCKSSGEYCGIVEYTYEYINEVRQDRKNAEGSKPRIHEVVNDLLSSNGAKRQQLLEHYRQNHSQVSKLNENASPGFASDVHATYHYHKHKAFGTNGDVVTPEKYFEMIKDITGRTDLITSTKLTQEGDKVTCTFINPNDGAMCVVIEPLLRLDNDGVFVATLFYNKRFHKHA